MAGTVTISREPHKSLPNGKTITKVRVDWVADGSNGSVPNTVIPGVNGYCVKAITSPGGVAPTNAYTIKLLDPDFNTFDSMQSKLANRSSTNVEEIYPAVGTQIPMLFAGDYTFNLTGNVVNSATGTLILYMVDTN